VLLADHPLLGRSAERGATGTDSLPQPSRPYREVPLASGGRHRADSGGSTPTRNGLRGRISELVDPHLRSAVLLHDIMTIELTMLALSIVLGFVHIVLASHAKSRQYGYRWTASARDEIQAPLAGVAGRLERASTNYLETFPLFAAAVLIAHVAHRDDALTHWGVQLYFWARVVYLPLYAFGVLALL
jgi:uncharacterized MAPEG superfamily protein